MKSAAGNDYQEPLAERLLAFIEAETWDESRLMLETDPELLTDQADVALAALLEASGQDTDAVEILEQHQALLQRCREVGIEAAFGEFSAGSEDLLQALARATEEHPELREAMAADPWLAAIQELLTCNSSAAVTELVGRRPELLGAETDARLQQMAARARVLGGADGEEMANLIEERQATLRELRDLMAEADLSAEQVAEMIQAAQQLVHGGQQALSLFDTIQEFVETPDWTAARSYVEKHPELLGDKAEALLGQLIALAESQHDEETVRLLEEHCERLAWARTEGLDAIGPAISR